MDHINPQNGNQVVWDALEKEILSFSGQDLEVVSKCHPESEAVRYFILPDFGTKMVVQILPNKEGEIKAIIVTPFNSDKLLSDKFMRTSLLGIRVSLVAHIGMFVSLNNKYGWQSRSRGGNGNEQTEWQFGVRP